MAVLSTAQQLDPDSRFRGGENAADQRQTVSQPIADCVEDQ
jgi:hypothetical protein